MLGWMLYAIVVSTLLSAAAWMAERSADTRGAPARLYWSLAIVASLLAPVVIATVSIQLPPLGDPVEAPRLVAAPLRQMTSAALAPARWLEYLPATPATPGKMVNLNTALALGWAIATACMVAGIIVQGVLLQRNKARWPTTRIAGVEVFVSEAVGPAIVGLLQPRIVVPRWIASASPEAQALIIAHERTHLDADDARLLAIAVLLIVCVPWNLPLWWQLRRLRLAIELDCDARVLRGGGDMTRYGETLLMVGARHSSNLAVVAAMSEPRSNLEQRLRRMLSRPAKAAWASGSVLAALGLALAASATAVSPPNRESSNPATVDAATLDGYVGFYDLNHLAVMTVARKGNQLSVQTTGSAAIPAVPKTSTDFAYRAGVIHFVTDAQGRATKVVGYQNGVVDAVLPRISEATATKFNNDLLARIESMRPAPGSQAALAHAVDGIIAGAPDYQRMEPRMAKAVRDQMAATRAILGPLGPVQAITFSGVGPAGNDVYVVRHAHGAIRWVISLNDKGQINGLGVNPWP